MDYAERIRELREDNYLNQTAIAKVLNVVQMTYSDYELKKTRIPLESMIKLAKFYNVNMDYICGISNEKKPFPLK